MFEDVWIVDDNVDIVCLVERFWPFPHSIGLDDGRTKKNPNQQDRQRLSWKYVLMQRLDINNNNNNINSKSSNCLMDFLNDFSYYYHYHHFICCCPNVLLLFWCCVCHWCSTITEWLSGLQWTGKHWNS